MKFERPKASIYFGLAASSLTQADAVCGVSLDARVTLVDDAGNVVAATMTDADGGYTFGDLPEGSYTVVATGYPPSVSMLTLSGGKETEHDVVLTHEES